MTPHRFLVSLRIARARELLLDPRNPVTEIAAAVGYQTPSAFATAFRALEGMSPSEFLDRLFGDYEERQAPAEGGPV